MENQLALVTGASSGIGLSLATELAARGYDLIICSAGDRLNAASQALRAHNVRVAEVEADLAASDGIELLWKQVTAIGRNLDVACLNAGVGVGGLFTETDLAAELNMVALNCTGTVHLAKHVVQKMTQQGEGKILFTASIAGEMVAPREAVYAATKAFVLSFAHSLRYELRDTGITVTALQPDRRTPISSIVRVWTTRRPALKASPRASRKTSPARDMDALFEGKDHVYAASFKTKMEGMLANAVPGSVKGAMHEKMAKPLNEK